MSLQSSHLALIDTLMMAYTVEMVSVERVMSCINRYSSAEPSHSDGHIQELPYDTEDAIITWINKVHTAARSCTHKRTHKDMCFLFTGDNNCTHPGALYSVGHTRLCFTLDIEDTSVLVLNSSTAGSKSDVFARKLDEDVAPTACNRVREITET